MKPKQILLMKIFFLAVTLTALIIAGRDFYAHRTFREPVVPSASLTMVKKLSDYLPSLKNKAIDCNIYFFDSKKPGGTVMIIGGSHAEEPAGSLAAQVLVEKINIQQGKMIVVIHANRSSSTVTRPGDAYPQFYHITTPWGIKKFRMGDRWTNPLDCWPDPEVYVHYPSRQMLAYMDIRNINRTWPGRKDGSVTEQASYAFMELIRKEKVDLFIDFHEAELEYPVINTIVAHEKGQEVAATVSMMLTGSEFTLPLGMEFSPPSLHGLTHREVGDHSDAASLLFEAPEPFLDRVRAVTDEKLLLTGKDPFVVSAGKKGLLYSPIDSNGWSIDTRVGRHLSTTLEVIATWSSMHPDKSITLDSVPRLALIEKNGIGFYFTNPQSVDASKVFYE